MKKLVLSAAFLVSAIVLRAQAGGKLWAGIEAGHGFGILERTPEGRRVTAQGGYYNALEAIAGYKFSTRFSLGLAVGLYHHSFSHGQLDAVPVFLRGRFRPLTRNPHLWADASVGLSWPKKENDSDHTYTARLSVGYDLFTWKGLTFSPSIGYDLTKYSLPFYDFGNNVHSLFFRLGIYY